MSKTQTKYRFVQRQRPDGEISFIAALKRLERDKMLTQSYEDRELASAQMDEDWLGVKLLAYLRESPDSQASELAVMTGAPVDAVAPILARLARAGAVAVRHRQFACTEKGTEILNNLEASTGISLTP